MALRQKAIFDTFDISGGGGIGGYDIGGGGSPALQSYNPPPITNFDPSMDAYGSGLPNLPVTNDIKGLRNQLPTISMASTRRQDQNVEFQDYMNQVNQAYTPETEASNRLNSLLNSTPNINDYSPSIMRKLTAGLQSIKDPTLGQKTLNQPYLQDIGEWSAKVAPYQAAATAENARNTQERTLVSNALTSLTAANRADIQADTQQKRLDSQNRIADQKAELERTRQNLQRARDARWTIKESNGKMYGVDQDGGTHELGMSAGLSDIEKINKKADADIRVGQALGRDQRLVGYDLQGNPIFERVGTGQTGDQTGPGGTITPSGGANQGGQSSAGGGIYKTPLARMSMADRDKLRAEKLQRLVDAGNTDIVPGKDGKLGFRPMPAVGATKPGTSTFGFGGEPYTQSDVAYNNAIRAWVDSGVDDDPPAMVQQPPKQQQNQAPAAPVQQQSQAPQQQQTTEQKIAQLTQEMQNPALGQRQREALQNQINIVRGQDQQNQAKQAQIAQAVEALKNPNLEPRVRQSLEAIARGGGAPIGLAPSNILPPPPVQGPSVTELQDKISMIKMRMQNPGNSAMINKNYQDQINLLQQQLHEANNPPLGPPIPPGFNQQPPPQQPAPQQQAAPPPQPSPRNQQTDQAVASGKYIYVYDARTGAIAGAVENSDAGRAYAAANGFLIR